MGELVTFCIGAFTGALTVITWALCAADKRGENNDDTSDR